MAEIACHVIQEGMIGVRLHGGPWDGKEVGIRDSNATAIRIHGPRHGNHTVWITHLYERRENLFEFVATETEPLSAWGWDPPSCS
jgi:hypothetical protein